MTQESKSNEWYYLVAYEKKQSTEEAIHEAVFAFMERFGFASNKLVMRHKMVSDEFLERYELDFQTDEKILPFEIRLRVGSDKRLTEIRELGDS